MKIEVGTNRLVFIFNKFVIKFPYRFRGIKANIVEYCNSIGKTYVAKTRKIGFINIQECLTDITIFPLDTVEENVPQHLKELWKWKLHNRFQVGKSKDGTYKFFDYEDVKFKCLC